MGALASLPFVRMLALSGGTAHKNARTQASFARTKASNVSRPAIGTSEIAWCAVKRSWW